MKTLRNLKTFDDYFAQGLLESLSDGDENVKQKIVSSPEWQAFNEELTNIDPDTTDTSVLTNKLFDVVCRATHVTSRAYFVINSLFDDAKNSYTEFVNYLCAPVTGLSESAIAMPTKSLGSSPIFLFFDAICNYLVERNGDNFIEDFVKKDLKKSVFETWCRGNRPDAYSYIYTETETDQRRKELESETGFDLSDI